MSGHISTTRMILAIMLSGPYLAGCGPKYSPPGAPATACRGISEATFNAAKKRGAASARATIHANGGFSMSTGSGVLQCSSFKGSKQICRRPNDFVVHYTLADGSDKYVLIPKNREYRLTIHRKPIPCEVIDR